MNQKKKVKICMIVPEKDVKGGIASVVNGYRTGCFGEEYMISYVESYCNGGKLQKLVKAICSYVKFIRELYKNRPDIVHIHSSFGPSFWRKLPFIYMANWSRVPVVNHIHGAVFEQFYSNASGLKKKLIKKVYLKCRILVALSEEWQCKLELIVPKEKIIIIENYCVVPKRNIPKNKQILFLGEIGERKGCFDIPAIYAEVLKKEKEVPLIIGGDGEIEKMQELFRKEAVEDNVSFLGWVRGEEKDMLLQKSSIFLFPSYNEGMPMALLEAMAYGLAIVTTNVGGIPKLIEQGKDGFICEPGDIHEIAEKITELIENDEVRTRFGAAARKKVAMHYSLEMHIEKLCNMYEELLRG